MINSLRARIGLYFQHLTSYLVHTWYSVSTGEHISEGTNEWHFVPALPLISNFTLSSSVPLPEPQGSAEIVL